MEYGIGSEVDSDLGVSWVPSMCVLGVSWGGTGCVLRYVLRCVLGVSWVCPRCVLSVS